MLSEALIWQFCWSDENVNIEHHCQGSKWLCVYVFILCVGWARRRFLPVSHHFISSIPPAAHSAHIVPEWVARALDLRLLWKVTLGGCRKRDQRALVWVRDPLLSRASTLPHTKNPECAMRWVLFLLCLRFSHFKCIHTQNLILVRICCSVCAYFVVLSVPVFQAVDGKRSELSSVEIV